MQFTAKVVGQTSVVVMDTKVGGANLAYTKLLLLVARCWHGVAIFNLKSN